MGGGRGEDGFQRILHLAIMGDYIGSPVRPVYNMNAFNAYIEVPGQPEKGGGRVESSTNERFPH